MNCARSRAPDSMRSSSSRPPRKHCSMRSAHHQLHPDPMSEAHMPTLHSVTFDAVPFLCALDGDRATFVEFSRGFLADFPDALSSIYAAAEARDPDALGDRVHALRGSLAIFHAHPMLHELEAIERLCHTRPTSISVDLMRTLAVP